MKWERYNAMTLEHQKEYDYRFKRETYSWPIDFGIVFALKSIIVSEIILIGSVYTVPSLSYLKQYGPALIEVVWNLSFALAWIIAIQVIVWIIATTIYEYKKHKWLKKHGYK